jgi:Saccharopine dehydrogenase NADP binding domain
MSNTHSSAFTKDHKVVVFGASGHTGRFVVSELARRGIMAILAGRDSEKLRAVREAHPAFETRVVCLNDPASLDRALLGASLVINCAGPFVDTAAPVVEAVLRARIHYLDVTAEQAVALAAFERFSDAARMAGVVIMPSMAFYGGLGDLLATAAMSNWPTADEIQIAVALDSWKPTQGTRLTGQRNSGRRLVFSNNRLSVLEEPSPKRTWSFPPPFGKQNVIALPLAETIIISRHLRVPNIHAYMNLAPLDDLHDPSTPAPTPVDERGRSAQEFLMEARVHKGDEERRAMVAGRDIYAVTAPIIVEAAERILAGEVRISGTVTPGEIFNAEVFLRTLSPEHFSLELAHSPA